MTSTRGVNIQPQVGRTRISYGIYQAVQDR
nr:MAG TPA: hypothetical protein [Caudoviricetes sp.]